MSSRVEVQNRKTELRRMNQEGVKEMEIKSNGSQPSGKGPEEYFTGTVRIDPLFQAPEPARVVGASVTFEPGARTAWHTHPLGQTLVVTHVGFVGVSHGVQLPGQELFFAEVHLLGGPAPVR